MRHLNPLSKNHLLRIYRWDIMKNISVNYRIVSLENLWDENMFHPFPVLNCERLYIRNCGEFFISNWVNENIFPNLSEIYISSSSTLDLTKRLYNVRVFGGPEYNCFPTYLSGNSIADTEKILESHGIITNLKDEITE